MMRTPRLRQLLPPRFPWREGNQFELLIDGRQYFPAMLTAIAQAQSSIELEMYLVSSGKLFNQFRQALLDAAARGVQVRMLFDDYGAQELNAADRQALQAPGIELIFFNTLRWRKGMSNLLRNHRKLLLIDRRLAYVGGTGLTDEFIYEHQHQPPWHEVMLSIRGPVINDWLLLFERTWFSFGKTLFKQPRISRSMHDDGAQRGRVCASDGPRAHHVEQSLYRQLQRSQRHVWLVTPYFIPSLKLRRLLIQAAKRGLDVRVLSPGQLTDHPAIRHASRRHYARLLRNGVRIFEYRPRFIHAKIAVCDDWVSLGSTNFDRWNLRWNLDANQEIDDAGFAMQVRQQLQPDFADSEELHYDTWLQRPLYLRLLEWWNGKLDQLLARLR
ncbi:MAG: phosphatidylserine/phosphatidylglycerophosphate/cardiolipin synthase family protein [Steroidobacteraceae bacterium]